MTRRQYSNTATEATLTAGIAAADTSFTLASFAGYPTAPFIATISRGESDEEVVLVTAVSGSTVSGVTRGYDGTSSKSHAAGATFLHTTVAKDFDEANAHVNATTGVHGLTGALVGTTDVQTLSGKTLTAPTLAGATITGTASLANGTVSGTFSVSGATTLGVATLGATTATTLTLTGAATLASATLSGALTVSGLATLASAKVTAVPSAANDVVRKDYADALGVSTATVSTIARRDAAGRLQVVDPAAAADVATKNYVDTHTSTSTSSDTGWKPLTLNSPATGTGQYRVLNGIVYLQLNETNTGTTQPTFVHCTLPAEARPNITNFVIGGYYNNQLEVLSIQSSGVVTNSLGSNTTTGGLSAQGSFPL